MLPACWRMVRRRRLGMRNVDSWNAAPEQRTEANPPRQPLGSLIGIERRKHVENRSYRLQAQPRHCGGKLGEIGRIVPPNAMRLNAQMLPRIPARRKRSRVSPGWILNSKKHYSANSAA